MDWKVLQEEHRAWVQEMYPNQPAEVPAAGLVEEAGELLHALLKIKQRELWGKEDRYSNLEHDLEDAIGDCAIYVVSLCNACGKDAYLFRCSSLMTDVSSAMESATRLVSEGCSAMTAKDDSERGLYLFGYLCTLRSIAHACSVDFDRAVDSTWQRVKQRNRADRKPEVVTLCGSTRFKQSFIQAAFEESLAGRIVQTVGWFSHADSDVYELTAEQKVAADKLHKHKIERGNQILVIDDELCVCSSCRRPLTDGCGCCESSAFVNYWGSSTQSEIEHALLHGKLVRYRSKEKRK